MGSKTQDHLLLLATTTVLLHLTATVNAIGVNYGTLGNNLPPPTQVANFLKTQTIIDSVKVFDTNPDILSAFANTGITVTVTVGNGDIPSLTNLDNARRWVASNIAPFKPQTLINRVLVGNEILLLANKDWTFNLVPAMRALHQALVLSGFGDVQVTTPNFFGIFSITEPPSAARFRPGYERYIFRPMLQFLRETKSPFMINPYPYFGYSPNKANYALFRRNRGMYDKYTGITYTSMYDAMLDATYSALKKLGFGDVGIVVGETGWPSLCEPGQLECTSENAAWFNGNLVRRTRLGKGTPLMPNRRIETYLFALFNENMKPGPITERNWGLFRPDFSPVYNAGIMLNQQMVGSRGGHHRGRGGRRGRVVPRPRPNWGKKWCVPRQDISDQALQGNIDYVCNHGIDCRPIQAGGACFDPNNVRSHASFVMNSYYRIKGGQDFTCDFNHSGFISTVDPSYGACRYI